MIKTFERKMRLKIYKSRKPIYTLCGGREKMDEKLRKQRMQASKKYNKYNTRQISLILNLKTDVDILQRLEEVGNKQGYIKELIRKDLQTDIR